MASVCSPTALKVIEDIAAFNSSLDWPVRQYRDWGLSILRFFVPRGNYSIKITQPHRDFTLVQAKIVDVKGTSRLP